MDNKGIWVRIRIRNLSPVSYIELLNLKLERSYEICDWFSVCVC